MVIIAGDSSYPLVLSTAKTGTYPNEVESGNMIYLRPAQYGENMTDEASVSSIGAGQVLDMMNGKGNDSFTISGKMKADAQPTLGQEMDAARSFLNMWRTAGQQRPYMFFKVGTIYQHFKNNAGAEPSYIVVKVENFGFQLKGSDNHCVIQVKLKRVA